MMVRSAASALLMPLKRVHSVRWRPRALDCAQCKESISLVQAASAAGVLMRIDGDKAAANCSARNQCQNRIYAQQIAGQADFAATGKPALSANGNKDSYQQTG